jgi:2'-5' RNA ligase
VVRRAFIAIELSDDAKAGLRAALQTVEATTGFSAGRWVSPERMHLTLRFLGDTEDALIAGVAASMDRIARTFSPLSLELAGVGFFPDAHRPRIAWLGVGGESEELARLESRLSEELIALGIDRDPRPFHPHLTLARVRHKTTGAERRALVDLVRSLRIEVPLVARDLYLLAAPPDAAAASSAYAILHRAPLEAPSAS